jgi:hypothetical protein
MILAPTNATGASCAHTESTAPIQVSIQSDNQRRLKGSAAGERNERSKDDRRKLEIMVRTGESCARIFMKERENLRSGLH